MMSNQNLLSMEAIDYVKLFKLDQENYEFNRDEFLQEFGNEFLEYCQTTPIGRNPKTGVIYYYRFREIIRNFETKFWAISQLKLGKPFSKGLWNAFFALHVCPFRDKYFPNQVIQIRLSKKRKSLTTQDNKCLATK